MYYKMANKEKKRNKPHPCSKKKLVVCPSCAEKREVWGLPKICSRCWNKALLGSNNKKSIRVYWVRSDGSRRKLN